MDEPSKAEGKQDFIDAMQFNQVEFMQGQVKVMTDNLQNQINQLRAKIAALERHIVFLNDSKQDVKGSGGL